MTDERLSGLQNTTQTGSVRPYSSFIRFIKFILPLIILGIIGLLIMWPQLSKIETEPLSPDDLSALKEAQTENRLLNPVYNTMDSEGRPFAITAKEASQKKENNDLVFLTDPTAVLQDDDTKIDIKANQGEYNQADKILILNGEVVIKDDQDIILTTDNLTSDIANGRAQSNKPATLTSNIGIITGESVNVDYQKQITTFQGPAKAVINQ